MPIITYVGSEMPDKTKASLIKELTATATKVTGTPVQFMTVIIEEYKDTCIGLGGETLTEFKARLAAENKSNEA